MQKQKMTRRMAILFLAMLWLLSSVAEAQTYQPDMLKTLETLNFVPVADPYCTPNEGSYENLSPTIDTSDFGTDAHSHLCTAVSISAMPDEVVDWILVELRAVTRVGSDADPATAVGTTVIARKPALLLTNGRIVEAEDYAALAVAEQTPESCTSLTNEGTNSNCPDLEFNEGDVTSAIDGKDLYLVIRHRNHLDIMSSAPLTESSNAYTYDFTGDVSNAYGSGIKSNAKGLGKTAMFSGDTNLSGTVTNADYNDEIRTQPRASGYLRADANFSGNVTNADYNDAIRTNPRASSTVP